MKLFWSFLCGLSWLNSLAQSSETPSPITFPPSQYWDGHDGSWSSFAIQVGTPPHQQNVRLLPSTSGNNISPVLAEGCTASDPIDCSDSRGSLFNISKSSSWQDKGLFELPLNALHGLPYSGNADFGFDNMTLDWQGNGGVSLQQQVVAGFMSKDFYLGYFGLSAVPINITSYADKYPSLLGSLRESNFIPSSTWGYSVGASYRAYPYSGLASLTLGGYDANRFDASRNVTSSGQDSYRPMILRTNNITYQSNASTSSLLSAPITTSVDSTIAQIWLPESACHSFEKAFNITWNSTSNLYMIDDESRSANQVLNPSVTFTLSSGSTTQAQEINITLPYAAFDLKLTSPNQWNLDGNYFPLRRAQNDTQYTLGRAFLQEAYLIADYGRAQFSNSPAIWPDNGAKPSIVPILPPPTSLDATGSSSEHDRHINFSTPALIGTIVGSGSVLLLAALTCVKRRARFRLRRMASSNHKPSKEGLRCPTPDLEAVTEDMQKALSVKETVGKGPPVRSDTLDTMMSEGTLVEKDGDAMPMELGVKEKMIAEIPGDNFVVEMGERPNSVYELEGG